MALSADFPYVVIPVQDHFLWHWFMFQMWLPYHLALALHSCMPCVRCGSANECVMSPQQTCDAKKDHDGWPARGLL